MQKIIPKVLDPTQLHLIDLHSESKGLIAFKKSGKDALRYHDICIGFDIETTTLENHHGYMYHWQLSINDYVILGRRWHELHSTIRWLKKGLQLRKNTRIICWIANEGFEFQFIRKQFHFTKVFAKDLRQPLIAIMDDCIEFRDCLAISGGSLKQLAKDFTATQKMVGDLDYSVIRNYETQLTNEEKQYCINDVVILSEWARYMFDTYIIPRHWIPTTKTGIIRKQVKDNVTPKIKNAIYITYPEKGFYDIMMNWVFRGGFVHANICHTDEVINDIGSVDFTSSYPARMNLGRVPRSKFIQCHDEFTEAYVNDLMQDHCLIIRATFHNIKATLPHSIESKSKCYNLVKPLIDNGRVRSAEYMSVWITELDWQIYQHFYKWEDVQIHEVWKALPGELPQYITKPLNDAYIKKDQLKKQGLSGTPIYALTKSGVNSFYGLMVQKMVLYDIVYDDDNDTWGIDGDSFDFIKNVHHAYTLPQWGVWITAGARYELLVNGVYPIEMEALKNHKQGMFKGDVLYCDTDSIKMLNFKQHKHIIDEYNNNIAKQMQAKCEKYGLPLEHFNDLGQFDVEYEHSPKAKYLGAKRYITTYEDGHTEVTIAGLPKSALIDYCDKNNKDIYDVFSDNMQLDVGISLKMASTYNDEAHEDVVDGVKMRELSSVGIYDIAFTLRLDQVYKMQIDAFKMKGARYETRIY